ncbi:MAG TPA: DUF4910 domain-containing protein [Armatimonadetes bacterium]|nr:DUF4910 domain-containing protein [Armatimonadota bacterium]
MFRQILDMLSPYVSGVNALDLIAHIHDYDRWSSFDQHHQAAQYCRAKMEEYGLEAEIFSLPADGETLYGDWIMPRAWDAKAATLTVLPTEKRGEVVLGNYREEPCSLVVYSKPTPPGGVTAEVVLLEGGTKAEDYEGADVEGKILFTRQSARAVKVEAVKQGAVGIISDYLPTYDYYRPPLELPDTRAWERFGPDYDYGGWGMKKGDTECWGFVLSPRQGQWLRELIRREGTVRLHAEVDAHFYDGTVDVVTGRIPGRTKEEVLMNGHLYEVGAIDDASGCGLAIEVLRCLHELIARGKLKPPKRGIRMLFTYECMGMMGAVVERPDLFSNLVAGVTLDCVGGRESLCRARLGLSHNPHAQSSYTDTLLRLILEHLSRTDKLLVNWEEKPYVDADNLIADPTIGVPCPLLIEHPYTFYHSSADTPDKLDPERLRWIEQAVATYVYFLANAGEQEARWLAEEVLNEAQREMMEAVSKHITRQYEARSQRGKETQGDLWRQLAYLQVRYGLALDSVARLAGRRAEAVRADLEPLKRELAAAAEQGFRRAARALGVPARKPRPSRSRYKQQAKQVVPERLVLGHSRLTRIPRKDRAEWQELLKRNHITGEVALRAEFWADGKRSVAEIEELVAGETGVKEVRLREFYEALARYGYVKIRGG